MSDIVCLLDKFAIGYQLYWSSIIITVNICFLPGESCVPQTQTN